MLSWASLFMSSANIEYGCRIGQHWVNLCQVISVCLFLLGWTKYLYLPYVLDIRSKLVYWV